MIGTVDLDFNILTPWPLFFYLIFCELCSLNQKCCCNSKFSGLKNHPYLILTKFFWSHWHYIKTLGTVFLPCIFGKTVKLHCWKTHWSLLVSVFTLLMWLFPWLIFDLTFKMPAFTGLKTHLQWTSSLVRFYYLSFYEPKFILLLLLVWLAQCLAHVNFSGAIRVYHFKWVSWVSQAKQNPNSGLFCKAVKS